MAKTLGDLFGMTAINQKLERIDNKLDKGLLDQNRIEKKIDKLLLDQSRYVSPELEAAVKAVARLAFHIDKQVPDQRTTTKPK
jgi:hypothetical protein